MDDAVFIALSESRILAEKCLEITDGYLTQGVKLIEDLRMLKQKWQMVIDLNDKNFEMMHSKCEGIEPDRGRDWTDDSSQQDTNDRQELRHTSVHQACSFTAASDLHSQGHAHSSYDPEAHDATTVDCYNGESTITTLSSHRKLLGVTTVTAVKEERANVPTYLPLAPNTSMINQSGESSQSSIPRPLSSLNTNASQLKRRLQATAGYLAPSIKRAKGDHDPENHEVFKMRQNNMRFEDIAKKINQMRVEAGGIPNLTANAIYGRYKRNAPLIAAACGEGFKQSRLDQTQGTLADYAKDHEAYGFNPEDDALLVQACNDVKTSFWLFVSHRMLELTGKHHEPKDCASRYAYL